LTPNECVCKKNYYSSNNGLCVAYISNNCSNAQFINSLDLDGTTITVNSCSSCSSNSYQNM